MNRTNGFRRGARVRAAGRVSSFVLHLTSPAVPCLQVSHSACVMTTAVICKLLRSKEATATVDIRNWPPVLDTGTFTPH